MSRMLSPKEMLAAESSAAVTLNFKAMEEKPFEDNESEGEDSGDDDGRGSDSDSDNPNDDDSGDGKPHSNSSPRSSNLRSFDKSDQVLNCGIESLTRSST